MQQTANTGGMLRNLHDALTALDLWIVTPARSTFLRGNRSSLRYSSSMLGLSSNLALSSSQMTARRNRLESWRRTEAYETSNADGQNTDYGNSSNVEYTAVGGIDSQKPKRALQAKKALRTKKALETKKKRIDQVPPRMVGV